VHTFFFRVKELAITSRDQGKTTFRIFHPSQKDLFLYEGLPEAGNFISYKYYSS